jgi:putative tricarboxylic transport membrane protein
MEVLGALAGGFATALAPVNLLYCLIGVLTGTLIGVLPGIGPVTTMAILLPITFTMSPAAAIIMLCGIYYGSQYGGSTTSILMNIPGEVGSIITALDGYRMAREGRAGPALGIAAIGSFIGGTAGVVALMFLAPPLAALAINFGPPEYFAMVLLGVALISTVGTGSILKALIMAALGLFASTVGLDSLTGATRFTAGTRVLVDGLGLVPVAIGMFGIAEVLANVETLARGEVLQTRLGTLLPTARDWVACRWPIVRGTVLGFVLGIVPGAGTILTTFFAYVLEKRLSPHPERFGTGAIEGVAGPETANNAATAGTMVPLLALGVPPNLAMGMLLGAFILHGIQPGPFFFTRYPDLFWGLVASMLLGNAMLLVLNLPLIGIWVRVLRIRYALLFPLIVLFCVIGVYAAGRSVAELLIMLVAGVATWLLRKLAYEPAPFLLAMVLGPMLETNFRQSLLISQGSFRIFLERPLSAALLAALAGAALLLVASRLRRRGGPGPV